jgi:hypothetical protein
MKRSPQVSLRTPEGQNFTKRSPQLSLRKLEGQYKAKAATVNKKVVRNFYRIYFEKIADFEFPEKLKSQMQISP